MSDFVWSVITGAGVVVLAVLLRGTRLHAYSDALPLVVAVIVMVVVVVPLRLVFD